MKNNVYIAGIKTILPELHDAVIVADLVYPPDRASELVNRLAKKALKSIGIKNRPFVRSIELYPEKVLAKEEYHPLNWGKAILSDFLNIIDKDDIGLLSVSYNISSHKDFLPNLACQIASELNLDLERPPEEITYLGCAAAFFSLQSAVDYCSKSDKAALIYNFDQCSWLCNPVMDREHPEFLSSLKANLLFSDGAVGLLIIPESMKHRFDKHLIKILDVKTGYGKGSEIRMNNGRFLVGDNVRSVMPKLVSDKLLKPMLHDFHIDKEEIKEWSIHQGGKPILESFGDDDVLGLTEDNLLRSKELFEAYGNFSSPSCLFILDSFYREDSQPKNSDTYGAVVGFGAGYYLGAMLYNWE